MAVTVTYTNDTYLIEVALSESPVTVTVAQARDAYQLAVAEGFVGTRAEWLASLQGEPGPAGDSPEIVILTLAEYMALAPEVQMDGRWYLIPKS